MSRVFGIMGHVRTNQQFQFAKPYYSKGQFLLPFCFEVSLQFSAILICMDKTNNKLEQPYKGKERRSSSRLKADANCMLILEDSHELPVKIDNISGTGAFATFEHNDRDFFLNQRVWLKFSMKVDREIHKIEVSGVVVRASGAGIGIAFRTTERENLQPVIDKLTEYIENMRARSLDM